MNDQFSSDPPNFAKVYKELLDRLLRLAITTGISSTRTSARKPDEIELRSLGRFHQNSQSKANPRSIELSSRVLLSRHKDPIDTLSKHISMIAFHTDPTRKIKCPNNRTRAQTLKAKDVVHGRHNAP